LKQKENKPSVSTHKEKKAENIFPHVKTAQLRVYINL